MILLFSTRYSFFLNIFVPIRMNTMAKNDLNRLKVVLVEQHKTSKWLADQMGKDPAAISKWCTNKAQP